MIKVLLFASAAEKLNQQELVVEQEVSTVQELVDWLQLNYPIIQKDLQHSMIVVNEQYCNKETQLSNEDVVAIIPPVSGG